MSSDLFNTPDHSIGSLTEGLTEIEGYTPELRVTYSEDPEKIILDDCVIIDYLENRGRKTKTRQFADNYFEGPQDIERLLKEFPNKILTPERFRDPRSGKFGSSSMKEEEIIRKKDKIGLKSEYLDIKQIQPRDGFREFKHADRRDKRIAEKAFETDAVVVTYDDDFLDFPVNYTTPGMLL